MKIREVYVFATDSRDGKLLELNASEKAGISPLGKHFSRDVIRPHIAAHSSEPDLPIVQIEGIKPMTSLGEVIEDYLDQRGAMGGDKNMDHNLILFPEYSSYGSMMDFKTFTLNQQHEHLCIVNASRIHQKLYLDKAVLTEVAKDAGAENIPKTGNYLHPKGSQARTDSVINTVLADFAGHDHVVLKAIDSARGAGIMVVPNSEIESTLRHLLANKQNSKAGVPYCEQGWNEYSMSVFQVQECAPGSIVEHRGREWSATTRIVWSVLIGESEDGERHICVTPHGAFYKLPRTPIGEGVTQNGTISYSYADGIFDGLKQFFVGPVTGRGAQVVIEDEAEFMREAEPVHEDLIKIFSYIDALDLADLQTNFSRSSEPVRQQIAVNLKAGNAPRHMRGRVPMQDDKPAEEGFGLGNPVIV